MPRNNRSAITNGTRVGIDLRTAAGRRWRDLLADAMRQTGGRNESLCRQLATLTVRREQLDAEVAAGEPVDPQDLIRVCGAISRLMRLLGLVEEAPIEDATDEVISMLRASHEARP